MHKIILGVIYLNQLLSFITILMMPFLIQQLIENTVLQSSLIEFNKNIISLVTVLGGLNDTLSSLNMENPNMVMGKRRGGSVSNFNWRLLNLLRDRKDRSLDKFEAKKANFIIVYKRVYY